MSKYAKRMKTMEEPANIIKGLFSSMNDPDVTSFGGGAIAKECLPVDIVREIVSDIMTVEGRGYEILSYGPVIGAKDLREVVVKELLAPKGVQANADNIIITTGGMEAMSLMCQLFIEPGDVILVESPTFVHSVETFSMFEAKCIAVEMDDDGMVTEDLEEKIIKYNPKIVYVIPTFQNPTGRTLSLERRQKIAELGSKYDVIILEDDPYRDIRYSGNELLPIKAFDKTGHTVLANSFSKIFSPGSRIGYVYANDDIISKMTDAKSASNSHTSLLPQIICAEFFKRGYYPEHHKLLCDIHRERRDAMIESIDKFFPEGTKRTFPDGGLFTWVELPGGINTTELLKESTLNPDVKVSFVAGEGFFTEGNGKGSNCMRLSFGGNPADKIRIGIERLGNLIKSKLMEEL
ncbi:MAG: PLP-dependent aminotransferase family protein [Sedimentibacter sp.]|nr:PLP-dependent aminotransferase family protein [Tissierellia bacterium]MDD3751631.1 PLP-dependent aminotransferase family protein [Tissierellia bacterium]MDD4046787.1 PLP-dependent aminotransferase family protein [Tissierellia bacterium]